MDGTQLMKTFLIAKVKYSYFCNLYQALPCVCIWVKCTTRSFSSVCTIVNRTTCHLWSKSESRFSARSCCGIKGRFPICRSFRYAKPSCLTVLYFLFYGVWLKHGLGLWTLDFWNADFCKWTASHKSKYGQLFSQKNPRKAFYSVQGFLVQKLRQSS